MSSVEFNSDDLKTSDIQANTFKVVYSDLNEQSLNRATKCLKQQTGKYDQMGFTHISALLEN